MLLRCQVSQWQQKKPEQESVPSQRSLQCGDTLDSSMHNNHPTSEPRQNRQRGLTWTTKGRHGAPTPQHSPPTKFTHFFTHTASVVVPIAIASRSLDVKRAGGHPVGALLELHLRHGRDSTRAPKIFAGCEAMRCAEADRQARNGEEGDQKGGGTEQGVLKNK